MAAGQPTGQGSADWQGDSHQMPMEATDVSAGQSTEQGSAGWQGDTHQVPIGARAVAAGHPTGLGSAAHHMKQESVYAAIGPVEPVGHHGYMNLR